MNWLILKNCKSVDLDKIPILDYSILKDEIIALLQRKLRLIFFFGYAQENQTRLFIGLSEDENSQIYLTSSLFSQNSSFSSLSQDYPEFLNFEREFYEEFNIYPENHPWLKPFRFKNNDLAEKIKDYPFFSIDSEEIHEVAVGPIHAGVIEPGHFRFLCNGEKVLHLEIQLGYQHRNIEKLFLKKDMHTIKRNIHLAESIAGDTVIGHGLAYAQAIESLAKLDCNPQAELIRAIALELERVAIHIGDLSALANDIAYISASSYLGNFRTMIINLLLAINGNRFGRGLLKIGGVSYSLNSSLIEDCKTVISKVQNAITFICEKMFADPSVLSRMEHTGILKKDLAEKIGLVGLPARASGLQRDVRADHPFGFYKASLICPVTMDSCDVFARSYMRYIEIQQSIHFIQDHLDRLNTSHPNTPEFDLLTKNQFAISMTEGWRGEIVHCVITDQSNSIARYKIKDSSFNNWFGLALAMRDNAISDFPLCNKSFNLSYCGNDL